MSTKIEVGQVFKWVGRGSGPTLTVVKIDETTAFCHSNREDDLEFGDGDYSLLTLGDRARYALISATQYPARAAGQRWQWKETGEEFTLTRPDAVRGEPVWWCQRNGEKDDWARESLFAAGDMTLLAPQKAAAGAVYASPCQPMCEMGACDSCDREFSEAARSVSPIKPAAWPNRGSLGAAGDAKPAEATTSMCTWRILGPLHSPDVLLRHTCDGVAAVCGSCWNANERANCQMPVDAEDALLHILHNDAIPERLPRPRLAVDWYDDCLPESWR